MTEAGPRPSVPAFRCADAARTRADQLAGTAPQTRRWLLIEHPGPWPVDAIAGSGIAPEVLEPLAASAAASMTRMLLIRRPARARTTPVDSRPQTDPEARCWILAEPGRPSAVGSWSTDHELLAAMGAMSGLSTAGTTSDPIFLVCAHGVHDTCCALRGRPVAAALADRWPDAVWECSHVGGDRFAPNLVVLPDGFYYGYLDPARAVETVASHLSGQVAAEWLRGLAAHPPAVQSAVVETHRRLAPLAPHAVVVRSSAVRIEADGRPRTVVDLDVPDRGLSLQIKIINVRRPAHTLTCRASAESVATEHRIEDVRLSRTVARWSAGATEAGTIR